MTTLRSNIRRALTAPCNLNLNPFLKPVHVGVREAWGRLSNLIALLKTGEAFNAQKISRLVHRCPKTVHRDLDFLRKSGVKIEFDFSAKTFRLVGEIPRQFSLLVKEAI